MGYRSDWAIGIAAATEDKLDSVINWMTDYSTNPSVDVDLRSIMEFILHNQTNKDDLNAGYSDASTKCNPPWDTVMLDLKAYIERDSELDMGYVRIGENYDDIETWSVNGYVDPIINRSIDGIDFCDIPKQESHQVAKAVNNTPAEEVCNHCNKMKDVGKSCWWCGN